MKVLGKASKELQERYRILDLEMIALNEAVKEISSGVYKLGRAGGKTVQIKRAFEKTAEDLKERQEARRAEIWQAIYAELGIDPDGSYRFDSDTGNVYTRSNPLEQILGAIGAGMPRGECDCDECQAERARQQAPDPSRLN